MKVAIIYNKDLEGVINTFGMQNKETYSPLTVKKVASSLEKGGHNVSIIDGNMHVIERLQNFMPKVMENEQMGMVFNMAYGIQGESRYTHIPSMLEMLGIPYVGSSPSGHALALDKVITKIIMQKHGISTPDFWVFSSPNDDMSNVTYPVIVKPKMESVSFGLKVVYNEEDLRSAVHFIITEFQQQALVEQFIRGREFCLGLIGNNPVEAFPILEIDLENDPDAIQTVEDKKSRPRKKICPAHLPDDLREEMIQQSIAAFKALHLRDFSRVDIRMDEEGKIYLLEINSMASLGETGSYPTAARVAGYDFPALVNKILDVAAVRYFANTGLMSKLPQDKGKLPLHTKLRGFLRGRQDNIEKLLGKIVNINTFVRNVEGVNELGNLLKKELSTLGFAQEIFPQVEVGNQLFFTNSFDDDYKILLLCSLDNSRKMSQQEFMKIEDQKIFGTGVWEHKGGIAAAIAALQALKFTRLLKNLKIGILFTTDDSLQGKFARNLVQQKARKAKVVIGLHGGDISGSLVTSRSGSAVYHCSMNLMANGSSERVAFASAMFSSLINSWCEMSISDDSLVISPSQLKLDSNIMQPYAHGEVTLSVRFNEMEQFKKVDSRIRKLIPGKKIKNIIHIQLDGGLRRQPMPKSEHKENFWQLAKQIAATLDIRLTSEHRWSSSDICFIENDIPMLDGFGPIGMNPPKKSEYILRHSLLERALLLAMTLAELKNKDYELIG